MSLTTEQTFETALVQSLVTQGGYTEGNAPDYSLELGLFKYEVHALFANLSAPPLGKDHRYPRS